MLQAEQYNKALAQEENTQGIQPASKDTILNCEEDSTCLGTSLVRALALHDLFECCNGHLCFLDHPNLQLYPYYSTTELD